MANLQGAVEDKVFIVHGTDPLAMAKRLMAEAGVAGRVPPGASVILKPNLVVAKPASEGATTHTEVVAGVIESLLDAGIAAGDITVAEGSWVGDDTARAFAVTGMDAFPGRYGVRLFDLKKDKSVPVDTPVGIIKVCRTVTEAGYVINLPVMKGHCQTRMTCAIKNMKGCIPDAEKRRFHRDGLHKWVAALGVAVRPDVTLVDGICGDLDFEEGGNPVTANRMLLGFDSLRLDAHVCRLMGLSPCDVEYLPLAAAYGAGDIAINDDDIIRLNAPEPDAASAGSGRTVRRLAKLLRDNQACSACYANAIHALKRLDDNGELDTLPDLFIGQGWQGKAVDGVGLGRCCDRAARFVPGCPPDPESIVTALRAVRHS